MPTLNRFLRSAANGEILRDYDHASRTFVDGGTYRLAPKQKFLFYVVFNINPIKSNVSNLEIREVSALVKSASLPNFSVDISELNQYNRHTNIQTKINYQAVNIKFHDDSNNTVNKLWIDYYSYYYADTLYTENNYFYGPEVQTPDRSHIRWGLDNGSVDPFFKNIKIYSLHRNKFTEYTLINPIIKNFNHDGHDHAEGNGVLENSMDIEYESVKYATGTVSSIKGFGELHYDTRPSPIGPSLTSQSNVREDTVDLATGNLTGAGVPSTPGNLNMNNQPFDQLISKAVNLARGQNPTNNFAFPVAKVVNTVLNPTNALAAFAVSSVNKLLATSNGSGLAVPSNPPKTATTYTIGGANTGTRPTRRIGGQPTLNNKR